ncbi:MAG: TetR/AcrR family transcriptional regulator [Deltaproteobacteria bacterium]|nr:MAG: TetR/AcrR family transcriptional regulator [Deltaproteobacteria bacterium]
MRATDRSDMSNKSAKKGSRGRGDAQKRRKQILRAAVEVFAEKGYYGCRISDIASRAGVAYGLVYHYFKNKSQILDVIFERHWQLLNELLEKMVQEPGPIEDKLYRFVSMVLDAYRAAPELMHVIVIEIARSCRQLKPSRLEQYQRSFELLASVLSEHQKRGEISGEFDCKLLSYCIFGMLELVLTGFALRMLNHGSDSEFEALKRQLVRLFLAGAQPQLPKISRY